MTPTEEAEDALDVLRGMLDSKRKAVKALEADVAAAEAELRRLVGRKPCTSFQWIGQPLSCCDGCSRPAWDHDFIETLEEPRTMFGKMVDARWNGELIDGWEHRGLIDAERAAHMRSVTP